MQREEHRDGGTETQREEDRLTKERGWRGQRPRRDEDKDGQVGKQCCVFMMIMTKTKKSLGELKS